MLPARTIAPTKASRLAKARSGRPRQQATAQAQNQAIQTICTPEHGASTITRRPSTSIALPSREASKPARPSSHRLASAVTTRSG